MIVMFSGTVCSVVVKCDLRSWMCSHARRYCLYAISILVLFLVVWYYRCESTKNHLLSSTSTPFLYLFSPYKDPPPEYMQAFAELGPSQVHYLCSSYHTASQQCQFHYQVGARLIFHYYFSPVFKLGHWSKLPISPGQDKRITAG